jgi:hypothetical protein
MPFSLKLASLWIIAAMVGCAIGRIWIAAALVAVLWIQRNANRVLARGPHGRVGRVA